MKQSVLFTIFFLIMSSACTPSPSITPTLTVPPAKDATQIATQVRNAAKSKTATADAHLATPYGLSKGACSPFRGQKTLGCVLSFTAVPTEVVAGGSVTFTWAVTGTNVVGLGQHSYYAEASGLGFPSWKDLPADGSLTLKIDGAAPTVYRFRLWTDNPVAGASQLVEIHYACSDTYFFAPLHIYEPSCSAGPAVTTPVIQQTFEHGLMIWIQSEDSIYVLYNPGIPTISVRVIPGAEGLDDAETAAPLVPPADKYLPGNRFDKVWRKYDLREQLGWAIAPEQDFTSMIQKNFSQQLYLRAADGRIIFISNSYAGHMEYPHWGYLLP